MVKNRKSKLKTFFTSVFSLLLGLAIGFVANIYVLLPNSFEIPGKVQNTSPAVVATGAVDADVVKSKDLSIHFIELGNKYTGDCTLIKVGDTEMLIDAGSKESSIPAIKQYLDVYVTDGKLEYVVVTHAHEDHYAGFAVSDPEGSLFDLFEIGTIIEFAKTNKTTSNKQFKNYEDQKADAVADYGTVVRKANYFITNSGENNFNLDDPSKDVTCEILNHKYYTEEADTENDYSVCLQIIQGTKKYLFTGDLEKDGEESLVELNTSSLSQVELYKAGHHGSKTSSSSALLEVIEPKVVCVCCCAGSSEYTSKNENQFPTQAFIDRVSPYTSAIYVTTLCIDYKQNKYESFNGNIVICSNLADATITISCSNNTTKLKDTDWFKLNRTLPNNAAA